VRSLFLSAWHRSRQSQGLPPDHPAIAGHLHLLYLRVNASWRALGMAAQGGRRILILCCGPKLASLIQLAASDVDTQAQAVLQLWGSVESLLSRPPEQVW